MEEDNNILGKRISTLIDEHHLTQRYLSKQIGVTEVTISRYVKGTRKPNSRTLEKIANTLHVSSDYLLGRDSNGEEFEIVLDKIKKFSYEWTKDQKIKIIESLLDM